MLPFLANCCYVFVVTCLLTTVVRKVAENPITFATEKRSVLTGQVMVSLPPTVSNTYLHRIIDRNAVQHHLRTGTVYVGIRPGPEPGR